MDSARISKLLPRTLLILGAGLLLCCIFASQLFLSGYITSWWRAFLSEVIYWLSWGILAPAVFWMCRRLHGRAWSIHAPVLLLGACIAVIVDPLIVHGIRLVQAAMNLCAGDCNPGPVPFSPAFLNHVARVAGVNLCVYAGFVLAWHAATYYRESRDRQVRAAELESLLHQAQLQALRSQLNPHFLFNALHSIAELVHADPKLAEQLLVRLGELLRQVLNSAAQPVVPLAEELEFIRGYLDIEQMRLGDRLQLEWDVEPAVLAARVPSLILQPLVENAIQHGVAPTARPGAVTIRARRDGDLLLLEVRDTGPGMSAEDFERRRGIGITNTRARLERLYGTNQRLECRVDSGCVVSVRLPFTTG